MMIRTWSGKTAVCAVLAIVAIVLAPLASEGSWVVNLNNTIKLNNGPGNLAGEFTVGTAQPSSGSGDNTSPANYSTVRFNTFCVQVNEFFSYGEVLTIRGITQFSEDGHQPLASQTAALYASFMNGYEDNLSSLNFFGNTNATYNYTSASSRASDADLLQKAIWHFQGQGTYVTSETNANNKFVNAVSALSSSALLTYGSGVSILNLTRVVGSNNYYRAQDQLYYVRSPQGGAPVPEPSMMALFLFGAIGAGWTASRRKKT